MGMTFFDESYPPSLWATEPPEGMTMAAADTGEPETATTGPPDSPVVPQEATEPPEATEPAQEPPEATEAP